MDNYTARFFREAAEIISTIDQKKIEEIIDILADVRDRKGRLFILGAGGSAGNASHAVNDFRKLAGIEAYCPTDNVSELTARVNDDGWDSVFSNWLNVSKLSAKDCLFILSVGGGDLSKNISPHIVEAIKIGTDRGATIVGIVGRDGGATAQYANSVVIVPTISPDTITPHSEAFQAVVWHCIVTHPKLIQNEMKWESQ